MYKIIKYLLPHPCRCVDSLHSYCQCRYMYLNTTATSTHWNSIHIGNGLHFVSISQPNFRYPQSTAQVSPISVARSYSLQGTPTSGAEEALWFVSPNSTHFTQPITLGDAGYPIACLMYIQWYRYYNVLTNGVESFHV